MNLQTKIINKVKGKVNDFSHRFYKLPKFDGNKNIAYVLGVSNHPNAGDQEITLAQKKFILKYLPDYAYVEIEKEKVEFVVDELARTLKPQDIIFIQGGGTLSDLYPEHELPRQLLLKKLKDCPCKIIQFPVSFYYENIESFRKIKSIYNEAKNLTVFVRESKSYNILKRELEIPVHHIPDIVLSQDESSLTNRGDDVLIMFRSDVECVLPKPLAHSIKEHFAKNNNILITDNYVEDYVLTFESNRENLLSKKFDEFRAAKLIITDRLHGMIFAYVTKTPAVVFDNSYGKVKYSYEDWLSDSNYIKYLDSTVATLDDVINYASQASNSEKAFCFDVKEAFDPLIKLVAGNR